ncbi:MAG: HAMP domain-containing protein [Akkermansiaceae bacterium]|nr:HAMP domain-containing protein [Akkermansiaceae bacterium]MCP5546672.1 HAMP domain-containing protein [Akkermansiaceae bacterium]
MLRVRLLLGLLTLVLLLWAVGGAGFLILQDAGKRFDQRLVVDYQAIDIAHGFRSGTSLLNSQYLTSLSAPAGATPPDPALYQEVMRDFDEKIDAMRRLSEGNERWNELLEEFEEALVTYRDGYSEFFSNDFTDMERRSDLLIRMGNRTQRLTDLANALATLAEERLFASTKDLDRESRKNLALIATLVVLGTGIAVLIYFQLLRHLVEPVVGLKDSFEELRKGNFELSLPPPDRASEFAPMVASFNDMSRELHLRRRETDQRLMRKNLLNRALLSAIPSPVYIIADDGSSPVLNPAAEELNDRLGLARRLPGKARRLFESCQESGENLLPEDPREALLFRIGDEERHFLPRIFRFSSEIEEYSGWAVLLYDVTRIRWLDDMKSNMLATVSHEIRTPLTGIRMVLLLLLESQSGSLTEVQHQMLTSASEDCERLLETLNNLLELARAESGMTSLNLAPVPLAEIARESLLLFETIAAKKGIRIDLQHNGDLPEVCADALRLREVINNLVSNAIKHSPEDGTVTIRIGRSGTDFLRLSVLDEGAGVPDGIQDRIFERFFRAEAQTHDGVGLGLFISREIMRAHEGRIGVRDRSPDKPTEFFIDVPIA